MVFKCNFQFPVRSILLSLKQSLTRLFNVLKNFNWSFLEKVGLPAYTGLGLYGIYAVLKNEIEKRKEIFSEDAVPELPKVDQDAA